MVRVAPINLTFNPRTLWFDPGDLVIEKDAPVVVRTARGTEFGIAASDIIEVPEEQVKALKTPLRPVERLATDEDVERAAEMEAKSREALPVFKDMAREAHEDMHPVSVEFLLDGDKAVFYFEAEERIDFRELVRKLAAHFHVRIDMRQIGVRDEARMVGGLGHCGQELCCKRLGGEFCPVSIRMAKEQGLSLNPQKISGLCGRLMCCLRYEFDAYKDFKSRAPKLNGTVQTPMGPAKVVDHDVPREIISLKVEGEKPVKVPLADFDPPKEGNRPTVVGEEAWEEATTEHSPMQSEALIFTTSQFTGSDKLAEGPKVRHTGGGGRSKKSDEGSRRSSSSSSSRSRRSGRGGNAEAPAPTQPPRRRRRSTKLAQGEDGHALERVSTSRSEGKGDGAKDGAPKRVRRSRDGGSTRADGAKASSGAKQGQGKSSSSRKAKSGAPRPGQKSSGLRQHDDAARRGEGASGKGGARPAGQGSAPKTEGEAQRKPRRRRRSHKQKSEGAGGNGASGGNAGANGSGN
ncbi:regulatory iron-sulfur-containing complex subunit RicT [Adlercreutzia equolifaciens]|uniref:PSP1 domain-containing protein n=1 Tax=Adlercreutzia equolifaciens TaxID=446660 RepID=UPI0023AE812E|nr:regulatory iron-sulfur-containing complex subunit RicT [Adlercreutzia equolifaciens]MDE8703434.1 regulatory iron-sulfur-containing complex subunit RicT [Adlercreutzia equolifaciens]